MTYKFCFVHFTKNATFVQVFNTFFSIFHTCFQEEYYMVNQIEDAWKDYFN